MAFLLLFLLCSCCYFISASHSETDTIFQGQRLRDWEHLNSKNKVFRLQFFSPGTTKNRYLGILFNIPTEWTYFHYDEKAVWVANRDYPIPDASGSLGIDINGVFRILYNGGNSIVLNSFSETRSNLSATLLDLGNLVLREHNSDGSTGKVLWQSFDYPTNILLPGMKLGINFKTGHRWSLTSWISSEAPGSGSFTYGGDPNGTSQLFIWWHGDVYWSSGLWREGRFDNAPRLNYHDYYRFNYVSNEDEKYLTYTVTANHSLARFSLDTFGNVLESGGTTTYGACSLSGIVYPGCAERVLPECRKGDVWFERKQGYSFGESFKFSDSSNMSLFDCQDKCLQNCSCVAYASIDDNGAGCEIWSSPLDFTKVEINGRIINVLVSGRGKKWWIWLIIAVGALLLVLGFSFYVLGKKQHVKGKRKAAEKMLLYELGGSTNPPTKFSSSKNHRKDKKMIHGLNIFSFESIFAATSNFSISNKLGEGGFGPVYKGKLDDGQEVAIKRLSRSSGQGLVEFKNEIVLISKLQHTNLVRLLGCCIQGEERILVYEYMPQKSLDFFLFDCSRRELLDWTSRWNIIGGIAQGLLYLHKYSRFKVIHRDLKASNILLDDGMNPKISDFGMARIFELQESEINTNRVVGTYGYMAPEYAINGIVSMKTDIFSFGVLLLEIVSGKRNNSFHNSEYAFNLVGYAWELWKEGRAQELMDPTLDHHSRSCNEVMRCIHVALLCVQDRAAERPSMSDIVSMLINETLELPTPNKPVFFIEMGTREDEKDDKAEKYSINELTISVTEAR